MGKGNPSYIRQWKGRDPPSTRAKVVPYGGQIAEKLAPNGGTAPQFPGVVGAGLRAVKIVAIVCPGFRGWNPIQSLIQHREKHR